MKADDAKVWFNLGVLCAQKGQFGEATSAYREAIVVKPDFPEAWYNLGVVYGGEHHYPAAIDAFRQAVRLRPHYLKAWFNLGIASAVLGDSSGVMEVQKRLEALDPAKAAEFRRALSPPEG